MVNDVSFPTSTDDAPASSEGGAAYDADDARPTMRLRSKEITIKRVIEIEGESLDVNARYLFDYDPVVCRKMISTSVRNLNPSGQITEPKICLKEECQARDSMTLVHNRCRLLFWFIIP
ncbi:hypothetical protein CMV_022317 [Castanea mollissima]|uniref:DNA helicase n=1 Tax=Castanea mollissima TaxID=60419 RepID=A0A8J4QT25_9ROSI|nr:hypothetical protein CMV_022317 [Castanea mollissima]